MILRDCLVRLEIVTSARLTTLSPAAQLFFRNLLHACDGAARFEADVSLLRTILYGRCLHRVSRTNVSRWLADCEKAELIELYTVGGTSYGTVHRYRQKDRYRRARYPDKNGVVSQPPRPARPPPQDEVK